jgi:hypothetical protein
MRRSPGRETRERDFIQKEWNVSGRDLKNCKGFSGSPVVLQDWRWTDA